MIRARKLIGLEVIDANNGRKIGRIKDVLFSPGDPKISGFTMECRMIAGDDRLLPVDSILSIRDCVMIRESRKLEKTRKNTNYKKHRDSKPRVFGNRVVTGEGERIGYIEDVIIDEESFSIEGYVLTDGIIEDILNGKSILPYDEHMIFGEDAVIVKDSILLKNEISLKKIFKRTEEERT